LKHPIGKLRGMMIRTALVAVSLLSNVVTAAPPRVAEVDPAKVPAAELLATPKVRTLLGYTRRVLHLPDGHTLAAFSYSNSAPANWLFLIDARDLSSKRFAIPNNDIASHAAALATDGNIYVMPYSTPRAYRFVVARETFEPIDVPGVPEGEYTWDAIGAADGCVYFGTYPHACLGRYDVARGKTTIWKNVAPNTTYVSHMEPDGKGVRFRAWGPDQVWMRIDASMDQPVRIERPATAPAKVAEGTREPSWTERVDGAEITIGHFGSLKRRDLATGKEITGRVDNLAPGANAIMFLESVTPECVIGANYSQQHLWRMDPNTGHVVGSEDMIARVSGQPNCAIGIGGKGYVGIYVRGIVTLYDPAKPFAFETNPREIAALGAKYGQTRPKAAVTDGQHVYMVMEGDYSRLGGAMAVIDVETQQVEPYPQIVKDQNLQSLAYDTKNKLVWGGTNRWGQMKSAPPTQESAVVYAFDPRERKVVSTINPWPGVDDVHVIGCTDGGTLLASANGRVAMIDTNSRQVVHEGTWPIAPPRDMKRGADGRQYLLSDGVLYRWDEESNALIAMARAPGCVYFTEPSPGLWLFADKTSVYRVRL
jgi:hypothetical protein